MATSDSYDQYQALAEVGRQFPTEFLERLAQAANTAADDFLRHHHAPVELLEAISLSYSLQQTATSLTANKDAPEYSLHLSLSVIPKTVTTLLRLIPALGGTLADIPDDWHPASVTWNLLGLTEVPADEATEPSDPSEAD